ncbi:hypothetical protein [Halarchaeum sp. P4]|uniref:hypothetical protein n=1 Tax=Halarchaeum sp. P4 TaxID=3421639 RepID=UPI003EBECFC0
MRFDATRALAALGVAFLALAGVFAAARDWQYGAKATVAFVFGLSYLAVGLLARDDPVPRALRRSLAGLPVIVVAVFCGVELADVAAAGTASPTPYDALQAGYIALLGFPAGLGLLYGRGATESERLSVLLVAACCLLLGTLLAGVVWTSVWPSSLVMRLGLVGVVSAVVTGVGATPAYALARLERPD